MQDKVIIADSLKLLGEALNDAFERKQEARLVAGSIHNEGRTWIAVIRWQAYQ